jgi:tetratricopeptide (TPR) repeat protein
MLFMRPRYAFPLIALAVILIARPTLHHPLLHDDLHTIVLNPALRQPAAWPDFFTHPETFSPEARMYRPLLMISYVLNLRLAGLDPFGFHLVNLMLHLFACSMVFWLSRLLPPLKPWSFWITILFALHPVHTEALNYISCRSDLGASAFGLLAIAACLQLAAAEKFRPGLAILAILAFAVALGFKASAIVVPALILLLDFLFFHQGRLQNLGDFSSTRRKAVAATFLGLVLIALAYLALRRSLALETFFLSQPARPVPVNLLTQTRALILYLRLLFWPEHLSLEHQLPILESPLDPAFLGPAILIFLLLVLALACVRKAPVISLAVGWFLICPLPTFYVPLNVIASENRLYLASLSGVWILVALARLATGDPPKKAGRVLLALVAIAFAVLSLHRHPVWSSGLTLWRDAVRKAPAVARNHVNYGIELRTAGRAQDAVRQYLWALRLDPKDSKAYSNLATAYYDLGRPEDEFDALRKTLELDPANVVARRNLAYALAEAGRKQEAIEVLSEAVRLAPRRADLRSSLGALYLHLGRIEEGKRELEESLRLNPEQPEVRAALEQVRKSRGD